MQFGNNWNNPESISIFLNQNKQNKHISTSAQNYLLYQFIEINLLLLEHKYAPSKNISFVASVPGI